MEETYSRVVRASDYQCRKRNAPGFDPSILRHNGIWGAADKVDQTFLKQKYPGQEKNPGIPGWGRVSLIKILNSETVLVIYVQMLLQRAHIGLCSKQEYDGTIGPGFSSGIYPRCEINGALLVGLRLAAFD